MAEKSAEVIIKLRNVRGAFLHVFKKRPKFDPKNVEEKEKYDATALLDPTNPEHKGYVNQIVAEMKRIATEKGMDQNLLKEVFNGADSSKLILCAGKGDTKKDKNGDVLDGFAGMYFITARSETKPLVVDRDPKVALTEEDGKPYSGCIVNMNLRLYGWANKGKSGISAELRSVQFVKDGPRFGRPPVDPESEFEKLPPEQGAPSSASSGDGWDD